MLWAVLVKPEALVVDGQSYAAGEGLPLTKGQAQQLAKSLKKQGTITEFAYEDRGDVEAGGRQASVEKDLDSGPGIGSGAGLAGSGNAVGGGEQDNRGGSDGALGGVGQKTRRKPGRPRRNA